MPELPAVRSKAQAFCRACQRSVRFFIYFSLLFFAPLYANATTPLDTGSEPSLPRLPAAPAVAKNLASHGQEIEVGASLELLHEEIKNIDFQRSAGDDLRTSKQEVQVQFFYRASENLSALIEVKGKAEQQAYSDGASPRSEKEVERGETWVGWQRLFDGNASIKIGRQNFVEPRRWWWDDDLDALRFDYGYGPWQLTLGVAEALGRKSSRRNFIDPEDEDLVRFLGHANWSLASGLHFSAFYLRQRDDSPRPPLDSLVEDARLDESDADLRWIGLRATGDIGLQTGGMFAYWLDTAVVSGNETVFGYRSQTGGMSRVAAHRQQQVRGHAVDLGLSWKPAAPSVPTLALSHARGSGDKNLDDDTDRAFRQTGLHDPTQEFRYYGELLRPELSNLSITTASLGFVVRGDSRLTLGYHRFRQVHPAGLLRGARIESQPTGQDKDIGREISLLAEFREWEHLKVALAAATFRAGKAFGAAAGERANSIFLELTYDF